MEADIYWLTTAEGGRITPIIPNTNRGNTYAANTQTVGKNAWSVVVCFKDGNMIPPGTSDRYEIKFLVPEALQEFKSGDTLLVCEGSKVVARGVIV